MITYDVNTGSKEGRRRLRRVAKLCERHGQRVQKSVFECKVDALTQKQLIDQLVQEIKESEDSLRVYYLGVNREKRVDEFGQGDVIDFDEPLVL